MEYKYKAHPTTYRGVLFRSRLEAKWAAFFDNVKWNWEYEPCGFDGWIPDFAIYGDPKIIYVEVKPIVKFCTETSDKIDSAADTSHPIILIGQTCPVPGFDGTCDDTMQLGWMRDELGWSDASLGSWDDCIGYCDANQGWVDPISGKYGKFYRKDITFEVEDAWSDACNKTQWMPKTKR